MEILLGTVILIVTDRVTDPWLHRGLIDWLYHQFYWMLFMLSECLSDWSMAPPGADWLVVSPVLLDAIHAERVSVWLIHDATGGWLTGCITSFTGCYSCWASVCLSGWLQDRRLYLICLYRRIHIRDWNEKQDIMARLKLIHQLGDWKADRKRSTILIHRSERSNIWKEENQIIEKTGRLYYIHVYVFITYNVPHAANKDWLSISSGVPPPLIII